LQLLLFYSANNEPFHRGIVNRLLTAEAKKEEEGCSHRVSSSFDKNEFLVWLSCQASDRLSKSLLEMRCLIELHAIRR
jgi:hypothetical protein